MVAGLARKKKSQILNVDKLSDHLEAFRLVAAELTAAIDRDASSYDSVMAAFKLPQALPKKSKSAKMPFKCDQRGIGGPDGSRPKGR